MSLLFVLLSILKVLAIVWLASLTFAVAGWVFFGMLLFVVFAWERCRGGE